MEKVISKDGTAIAYERTGSGPPLILIDGALCSRAFGPMPKLAALLARKFTVFIYDRRGRGDSLDTPPYAKERELEDVDALIQAAGGSAHLLGLSSGGALALEAAAKGLRVERVVAYEPPFVQEAGPRPEGKHREKLEQLISENRRGDAVAYFMRDMVGAPGAMVVMMKLMPWIWRKLKAVAHTLPYDAAVMGNWTVPTSRLAGVRVPTLVCHGGKTDERLKVAARAVAAAIPGAKHTELAGQTHSVRPDVLAPAVEAFLEA